MKDKFLDSWLLVRNLNELKRFNIRVTLHPQNVSSHSLSTAILARTIAMELNERLGMEIDPEKVLLGALVHDFEECELGDVLIPSKSKISVEYEKLEADIKQRLFADFEIYQTLSLLEVQLIRLCDKLEGYVYCLEERDLGNRGFIAIANAYQERIENLLLQMPASVQEHLKDWRQSIEEGLVRRAANAT